MKKGKAQGNNQRERKLSNELRLLIFLKFFMTLRFTPTMSFKKQHCPETTHTLTNSIDEVALIFKNKK
ncbi:hypothetical protein Fmac_003426 [Flemingia macrophylla]|uniref:Uncharacterized protein n=1 Tax=Flemingia macrophylla TaxID=520843 RepID=A0ABD1NNC5_9FABA